MNQPLEIDAWVRQLLQIWRIDRQDLRILDQIYCTKRVSESPQQDSAMQGVR